jgi:hypothetical protein
MRRRPLIALLVGVLAGLASPAQADQSLNAVMNEAKTVGQASARTINAGMNQGGGQQWAQPAVDASPNGSLPTLDAGSASSKGLSLMSQCEANPQSSPQCEALTTATTQSHYEGTVSTSDLTQLQNGQLPLIAALSGTGIGGNYSGCTTQITTKGGPVYDTQYCYDYYLRTLDNKCTKTLNVEVTWHYSCPDGTDGPYLSDPYWSGGDPVPQYCTGMSITYEPACPTGQQIGYGALDGGWYWGWTCTDAAGVATAAPMHEVDTPYEVDANTWATERDIWTNPCAEMEARVPTGLLPPDGQNDHIDYSATDQGAPDKCERDSSTCVQAAQTRVIDNHPVFRQCWAYTNAFSCQTLQGNSDCGQPRDGSCTVIDAAHCVDYDAFITPPYCTAWQTSFNCKVKDTTRQESYTDCAGQVYQDNNGVAWDTGHPADTDLAQVAAYMEAGREAGKYIDQKSLKLFTGFDSRCKKKLWGAVNCCNKGAGMDGSLFSNYNIASGALGQVGSALVSNYTYDALFASAAPDSVVFGFYDLWGTGLSSPLLSLLAGDLSFVDFMASFVPGPWTIVFLIIEYSGILDCDDDSLNTAFKRSANLCEDVGEYCSSRLPIIHSCIERTHTYCCYNSVLAKLVNTQGKQQLGMASPLGSPEAPNCSGFSVSDFQRLDLSKMDLSEFTDQITTNTVNASQTDLQHITTCTYYKDDPSCAPVH